MIGRVGKGINFSELVMVEDRYKPPAEEHPGVSNRKHLC